ncbi:unnamed protein product, partial [Ectocarpus sp. 12 AP-2014]
RATVRSRKLFLPQALSENAQFLPGPWTSNSYGVRCWRKFPIDQTLIKPTLFLKRKCGRTQKMSHLFPECHRGGGAEQRQLFSDGCGTPQSRDTWYGGGCFTPIDIWREIKDLPRARGCSIGRSDTPQLSALHAASASGSVGAHCVKRGGHRSLCPRSGETTEALEQDRLRQRVPCPVGRRETQRTSRVLARWRAAGTDFHHNSWALKPFGNSYHRSMDQRHGARKAWCRLDQPPAYLTGTPLRTIS